MNADNAGKRRISAFELLFELLPDALEVLEICAATTRQRPASQRASERGTSRGSLAKGGVQRT
jgi:hypothetical protein